MISYPSLTTPGIWESSSPREFPLGVCCYAHHFQMPFRWGAVSSYGMEFTATAGSQQPSSWVYLLIRWGICPFGKIHLTLSKLGLIYSSHF